MGSAILWQKSSTMAVGDFSLSFGSSCAVESAMRVKKNPKQASDLFFPYILISASTPAGRARFWSESIVFGVAFEMSIRRL